MKSGSPKMLFFLHSAFLSLLDTSYHTSFFRFSHLSDIFLYKKTLLYFSNFIHPLFYHGFVYISTHAMCCFFEYKVCPMLSLRVSLNFLNIFRIVFLQESLAESIINNCYNFARSSKENLCRSSR